MTYALFSVVNLVCHAYITASGHAVSQFSVQGLGAQRAHAGTWPPSAASPASSCITRSLSRAALRLTLTRVTFAMLTIHRHRRLPHLRRLSLSRRGSLRIPDAAFEAE